jgi:hypothetical protein
MRFSESPEADAQADDALPTDLSALAVLVREWLGRRIVVAVLAPPDMADEAPRALADTFAAFSGARVVFEQTASNPEPLLARLHSLGPDVVLIGAAENAATDGETAWHARVLAIADDIGLSDRSFVALVGSHVTRQSARHLGFEDGFPLDTPLDTLLPALVREALARDEFRRPGSSPPCYLR